jgi:hypothetical protein
MLRDHMVAKGLAGGDDETLPFTAPDGVLLR